jgi:hypothetical protein
LLTFVVGKVFGEVVLDGRGDAGEIVEASTEASGSI